MRFCSGQVLDLLHVDCNLTGRNEGLELEREVGSCRFTLRDCGSARSDSASLVVDHGNRMRTEKGLVREKPQQGGVLEVTVLSRAVLRVGLCKIWPLVLWRRG